MYLVMNDKSLIGTRNGAIEKGILKYIEIPDDLLEQLDFSFIENLKTILRANEFKHIKHRKREPKLGNKLDLLVWVCKNESSILILDYSIWDKDIKKILEYFSKKKLLNKELQYFQYVNKNKKEIIKDIKKVNLSLLEYYLIALPFSVNLDTENMFIQKNFLIKTINNNYREDYEEVKRMINNKIKFLSDISQIFLSYISHIAMAFDYPIDENAFDSLEDTLVYNKLLTKKQIKEAHKEDID